MLILQDAEDPEDQRQSLRPAEAQPLLQSVNDNHDLDAEVKPHGQWQREKTLKLLAVMFDFFVMGISLTAIGALIPDLERSYHKSDGAIATIFVAHMIGYLCATATTQYIHFHLGRRGIALLSPLLRLSASAVLATAPSFYITLATYSVLGFGVSLVDSGWCAWASALPYANVCQGMMHGSFSAGCIVGPLAALGVLERGYEWNEFYVLAGILFGVELVVQGIAFRHDNASKYRTSSRTTNDEPSVHPLRLAATWMCGLFFFVYVGVESSFTDWIVVYMERARHFVPLKAALASSYFWIGMAVGRVVLGFVTEYFGLAISITGYIVISLIAQTLLRFVSSVELTMALLALSGFFYGPLFPSGVLLLAQKVPVQLHVGAIAAAAALGQLGGAAAPLGIGILADKLGIEHLLDVVLPLSVAMLVVWLLFTNKV